MLEGADPQHVMVLTEVSAAEALGTFGVGVAVGAGVAVGKGVEVGLGPGARAFLPTTPTIAPMTSTASKEAASVSLDMPVREPKEEHSPPNHAYSLSKGQRLV